MQWVPYLVPFAVVGALQKAGEGVGVARIHGGATAHSDRREGVLENTLQQVKFPNQAQRGHNLHLHCRVLVLHSVTPAAFTDGLTNHTVCVYNMAAAVAAAAAARVTIQRQPCHGVGGALLWWCDEVHSAAGDKEDILNILTGLEEVL